MQVANINMSNSSNGCSVGLQMLTRPKQLCGINSDWRGWPLATFSIQGIGLQLCVCDMIVGYQQKSRDAFQQYHSNPQITSGGGYVDGVSLTHGCNPLNTSGLLQLHKSEQIRSEQIRCLKIDHMTVL